MSLPLVLCAVLLAGESVQFDGELRPAFTSEQVRATAPATRDGLAKWARTAEGKTILRRFLEQDRQIDVMESDDESGVGRAPEPSFLTKLFANDPKTLKHYVLILNPTVAGEYAGLHPIGLGRPRTPADVMALAWAAEMLHIDFYADGIALPHHERSDFQERWQKVAGQLGFPLTEHVSD